MFTVLNFFFKIHAVKIPTLGNYKHFLPVKIPKLSAITNSTPPSSSKLLSVDLSPYFSSTPLLSFSLSVDRLIARSFTSFPLIFIFFRN
uniref:Uncharacterized protein n=1 Tax=Kalanchoe fedtschenkoi TaxID=63787 RepID=A0A7N0UTZ3_KALFE